MGNRTLDRVLNYRDRLSIRGTAPDGIFCVELSGANHRGAVAER